MTTIEYEVDILNDIDMKEFNDIAEFNNSLNDSILYSVVKFVRFLREKGYVIPTSSVISFCQMLNNFDLLNKNEYFLISKSVFCSSRLEYSSYDSLFHRFFSFDEREGLGIELDKKMRESKSKIDSLKEKLAMELDEKTLELNNKAMDFINNVMDRKTEPFELHKDVVSSLTENDLTEMNSLIEKLNENGENSAFLKDLIVFNKAGILNYLNEKRLDFEKVGSMLEQLMLLNFSNMSLSKVSETLISSAGILSDIDREFVKVNTRKEEVLSKFKKDLERMLLDEKNKYDNDISKIKMKLSTLNHRDNYTEGHNSVIELINNCDKTISKLTKTEYDYLRYYIRLNASKFRTRIGRSMKQYKSKTFDVKKTVQESIKFNGSPIQYYYKKPIVKKYKLVCILDISGSVSKYLELLLAFFFEISSVFNGGVKFYGFVSSLMDFTDIFKNGNLEDVVESLKGHRGYSNYGKAIYDFYENNYKKIDSNTIVIYFGDARNNKNESNCDILKKINSKVKYSVWLNPEERYKWDSGDSVMNSYGKAVDSVYCVNEASQLISFLNEFSIVKKDI